MSWRGARWAVALGAAFGAALFALELTLMIRSGAVGFRIDVDGAAAALIAVVKDALPALLGRVGIAYLAFGAALGLGSWLLASWAWERRGWRRALVAAAIAAAAFALLAWRKVVERPALADDLPALRPLLEWLVDRGEPWHPVAAALALLLGLLVAVGARDPWRLLPPAALTVVLLAAALPDWSVARPARRHPLVVVLGIDALRPDRLARLGGTRGVTPHLDAFTSDAVLFSNAYTPLAQTEPAWRSLLTARWPHHTGVRYPLTPDARMALGATFPERFARAGYQTLFRTDCSRFHYEGAPSGFADRRQPPRGAVNFLLEKLRFRSLGLFADHALGAALLPEFIDNRALAGIHDPRGYARRLAAELVERARQRPTLFSFHATAAHFPGDPVYPFYRQYVPATEPLERRLRMVFQPISGGQGGGWSREGSEALYEELLAQADAQLGLLLQALRDHRLYDEATIVILSDHGESFHADHPELAGATPAHGARLSEEENRIALAIKPPRHRGARTVESLVRLVDVGPTLLDLAGLPALEGVDGRSLRPLLEGSELSLGPLYAETGFTHAVPEAFDPQHLPGAPRTFDAYRLRSDGVVEIAEPLHQRLIAEKDVGAFDGHSWIIRSPRADGSSRVECRGRCPAPSLERWLEATIAAPLTASR